MTRRRESWGRYGNVTVTRDSRGRFVSWKRIIQKPFYYASGEKSIAVYGDCVTEDGERYSGRYEFDGNGRELYEAVVQAHSLVPRKRFVSVSAKDFLEDPFEYGVWGQWVDRPDIES
jgi:hypothetical protein